MLAEIAGVKMITCWHRRAAFTALALGLAGFLACIGCSHNTSPSDTNSTRQASDDENDVTLSNTKAGTPQPGQRTFSSPEEAAGVFKDAVAAKDRRTLVAI